MLLRRSEPPILSGSTKKLRSSSVIWFLGVIIESPTFFVHFFSKLPELFWVESLIYFELHFCSRSMNFEVMF